jgi:uncharacterized protein YodC (DUF2158 family)
MESAMTLKKQAAIALAVTLGISLSTPLATAALADPALPGTTATQSYAASQFHNGDLVHLRSGGPLMTITGIQGDQVTCSWSEWDGQLRSEHFPAAVLAGPITAPLYIE